MIEQTVKNADTDAKKLNTNGLEYYRYTGADALEEDNGDGIFLGPLKSFAVKADCRLTFDEIQSAVKILSYFWKTKVRGNESLTEWTTPDNETIIFSHGLLDDSANSALSKSGHPRVRFAQFVTELNKNLASGTTPRKHGTRLENGITRFENGVNKQISFTVWVDEVRQVKEVEEEVVVAEEPPAKLSAEIAAEVRAIAGGPRDVLIPTNATVNAQVPAWEEEPESFLTKDAGDLTFNEVKDLLAALKLANRRASDAEAENEDLRLKLENIRLLLK